MNKKNLIYGRHTVIEAIKYSNRIKSVYLYKKDNEIYNICKNNKIEIVLDKSFFNNKKNLIHQGVMAYCDSFKYDNFNILESDSKQETIIVLDRINSPQNLGSIIRTAVATNVKAIIIAKNNQVDVTPLVEKVAVGACNYIKIIKVTNIVDTLKKLKKMGHWIVGSYLHEKTKDYREVNYAEKTTLVIGSEQKGTRNLVLKQCDFLIKIPHTSLINSLNASVAAGVMMYEIYNQKHPIKIK